MWDLKVYVHVTNKIFISALGHSKVNAAGSRSGQPVSHIYWQIPKGVGVRA